MSGLQDDTVLEIDHGLVFFNWRFGTALIDHFPGQMQEESKVLNEL